MDTALDVAQIIVCVVLSIVILTQAKGSGFTGSAFGGDANSIYHTRRGIERTLFTFTIVIGVAFVALSLIASIID